MIDPKATELINAAVKAEKEHGNALHGPFHNHHEAWAVLKEELEELDCKATRISTYNFFQNELWLKIKNDREVSREDLELIWQYLDYVTKEAVQCMAMLSKWEDLIQTAQYVEKIGGTSDD